MKKIDVLIPSVISFATWFLIGLICDVDIVSTFYISAIIGSCVFLCFGIVYIREGEKE